MAGVSLMLTVSTASIALHSPGGKEALGMQPKALSCTLTRQGRRVNGKDHARRKTEPERPRR